MKFLKAVLNIGTTPENFEYICSAVNPGDELVLRDRLEGQTLSNGSHIDVCAGTSVRKDISVGGTGFSPSCFSWVKIYKRQLLQKL